MLGLGFGIRYLEGPWDLVAACNGPYVGRFWVGRKLGLAPGRFKGVKTGFESSKDRFYDCDKVLGGS